jgi:hypothetical protein
VVHLIFLASFCTTAEPPKEKAVSGVVTAVADSSVTLDGGASFRLSKETEYLRESGYDPEVVGAKELVKGKAVDLAVVDGTAVRVYIKRFVPLAPGEEVVRKAVAMKVALDGDAATVTVAFNYTGKRGDPPTFQGVRMYTYKLTAGKGPTRVGWEGTEGKQTVVLGGKKYTYYPAATDRKENGTLSVAKADGGKVRLTGVYHYDGVLFVIDETVKPGEPILLEEAPEVK